MSGAATRGKKKGLSMEEKVVLVERWITAHPQPYTMKELQQLIPKHIPVIYQSVEECVQLLVAENRVSQDRIGVSTLIWKFPLTATQLANSLTGQPGAGGGPPHLGGAAGASRGPLTCAELLRRVTGGSPAAATAISAGVVSGWCAAVPSGQLREWRDTLLGEVGKAEQGVAEEVRRVCGDGANAGEGEDGTRALESLVQSEVSSLQRLHAQQVQLRAQHSSLAALPSLPDLLAQLQRATVVARAAADRWTDNYFLAEETVVQNANIVGGRREVRAALQVPLDLDFLSETSNDEEEENAAAAMPGEAVAQLPCDVAVLDTPPVRQPLHETSQAALAVEVASADSPLDVSGADAGDSTAQRPGTVEGEGAPGPAAESYAAAAEASSVSPCGKARATPPAGPARRAARKRARA